MTTSSDFPDPDAGEAFHARGRADALYRAAGARELDRVAIEEFGIAGIDLMERAGAAAWRELDARWPAPGRVAVLCGPGNNGGDGYVLARHAAAAARAVEVYALGDPERLAGDAATAYRRMREAGLAPRPARDFDAAGFDVVVDGLFGTGLTRALDGDARALVERIDAAPGARLALDLPSGLDADTGNVLGLAARADVTVTFIGLKQGLFTGDGRDRCGRIVLADLEVPDTVRSRVPVDAWRVVARTLRWPEGARSRRAHKGRYGHVLVLGGDHGFAGAARLCAEAAARCGAGLTSVATRPTHVGAIVAGRPEIMARGVDERGDLDALIAAASVLAVGPGLGRSRWSRMLLDAALEAAQPLVIDADALNLVAADAALAARVAAAGDRCVATPHPGEAARLLGCGAAQVEADRFAAARELGEQLGCAVVLKGAGTLVHARGHAPWLIDAGNPGMASGGMGDVLTGVVAALLAQGLPPAEAAVTGAALHAAAGDRAAGEHGERGLLAGDLLTPLRRLANRLG